MTIVKKNMELDEQYASSQQWAENTKGIYMNMLNGVAFDQVDQKYHMLPIQYSDVNMEGEKVRFNDNREFMVIYSCLATEYAHKEEIRNEWWAKARALVEDYKKAQQVEDYINSNNGIDLKRMRQDGTLYED